MMMDGEMCDPQQHKALQAELFQLSGITPEMISARLITLRAEAGESTQLSPKECVERTQLEPGSPREQKARLVSIRYVPYWAENPNDMQTIDGSEQERGQAAAAPAQAQYVVVNIESGQDGGSIVQRPAPSPEDILAWFSLGTWHLLGR